MALSDTLKSLSPSLYRLRVMVIVVAALVLPITVYYLLYVRSQTGYFNARNFRKLSLISSQIGSKLENAGSVLEKTSERFIRPLEEDVYRFNADRIPKQQNLNDLREVFKRLKDDSPQIVPVNIDVEKWSPAATPGSVTLTSIRYEADSSWLYLDYVSEGISEGTVIRVRAKTELSGLIQPFLSARVGSTPEQFQNILIAETETGRVILQHDMTQVRLASMDKLTSSEASGKRIDIRDIAQTSSTADIALAGSNYRLFAHPLKLSLPAGSATGPTATWIVTGLIKSDYFQTEAWSISIPYTILIVCGFIVALLAFSWPFLKLVLAGPKDRFKTVDVYLLVFATIIVLAVLTAFGLYGSIYMSVEAQMDNQVASLATDIKTNFKEELVAALDQLEKLSKNDQLLRVLMDEEAEREGRAPARVGGLGIGMSTAGRNSDPDNSLVPANAKPDIYQQPDKNKVGILPDLLSSCDTTYPYFDTAVWIDKGGTQRAKWTVKDYTTQYIQVSDRAYFSNIQKRHFYELGDHRFWLEPIISKTTGRNEVEISRAIPQSTWTLAFDMRLLSLMDPVLPDAFGYVIINPDGKVLFHSDETHHLGENLFQECDDDRNLHSAVIGRTDKPLNVRYHGQDHRFFVTTMEGFPEWSLVVFRGKQPLRSAFLEMLTSLTALYLIYCLVLMVGFTAFFIFYRRNVRKAWLWPEESKKTLYRQTFYILLGFAFVSLLLTILLHGQKLVWVIGGLGLLSALVFFVSLRFGTSVWLSLAKQISSLFERLKPARKGASEALTEPAGIPAVVAITPVVADKGFKRYDTLYVLSMSLLVLLISILPTGAFFKYQYESQIKLFIKHAQYTMATALARRDERIRSQYSNVPVIANTYCPANLDQETNILPKRLNSSWDVYDNFFYQTARDKAAITTTTSRPPAAEAEFLSALSMLLPLSSRNAIERRGLIDNAAVRGICDWESDSNGGLVLNLVRNTEQPAWPWDRLRTSVPWLGMPGLPALGIILLFVPLFLLVNYMVRKVFLLDIHKPTSRSLKKFLRDKVDRSVFVVVNAPFIKKVKGKESNINLHDFSSIVTVENWETKFDDTACGAEDVIAFDQFDYGLDDPQTNQRKRQLLERLLANNRRLLLFSSVEASQYSFTNGEGKHGNGDRDEAGRWAEVIIGNFLTEYAEDTDDRYAADDDTSFKRMVAEQRAQILKEGLQGRKLEEVEQLIDTLYTECAPREPLQRIGLQILRQRDFVELNHDHLLGRIVNQARYYYTHIWNSCSDGEKQTLCHLALDRRLSHRDPDIAGLLKRELIVRCEGLHLFNESFRQFVTSTEQVSDVAQHDEKAREGSWWQMLKAPILVTMMAIAGFLFWTQQDFFTSSLALVTGVTTIISALFKVMSMFTADPTAHAKN